MDIFLSTAGKRFRFEWIFKGLTHQFEAGTTTAVVGPNGSGKSTLMKVLSGQLSLSKGDISFKKDEKNIPIEHLYRQVSYAAPYIELIEEYTLAEAVRFHARLKPLLPGLDTSAVLDLLELPKAQQKEIRLFSSGMKQRVKLALALCSDTNLVLLDEPTTNLDLKAIDWFHRLLQTHASPQRTIVIASNDPGDLVLCGAQLDIMAYK